MMDNLISLSNIYFGSSELRYLLMSPTVRGSYEQSLTKEFVNRMIVNYKYAFTGSTIMFQYLALMVWNCIRCMKARSVFKI